ncbi:telomere binding protein [Coemansia sp. RSA 720]|nr:telomere binding protein [Coemansia sp. RSA 720]
MDVRQRFRELGKRVEELVGQIRGSDADGDTQQDTRRNEVLDSDLALKTSLLLLHDADNTPSITIPGISSVDKRLVTPVVPAGAMEIKDKISATSSNMLEDELLAALEAPLFALGIPTPGVLQKVADSGSCEWTQWWISAQASDVARHVDWWFASAVLGSASAIIAEPSQFALGDNVFETLVVPYVTSSGDYNSWSAVKSTVGVFASNHPTASTLTLATRVLTLVIERGQLLNVQNMLLLKGSTPTLAHAVWTEYIQIVATLPERVANKIDSRSIPNVLQPRLYFARLAKHAVASIGQSNAAVITESTVRVCELWVKLCRVGQLDSLCVELASALAAAAHERIRFSERPMYDQDVLAELAQAVARIPAPFGARVVAGIVQQLDAASTNNGAQANIELTLVLCALMHGQLDAGSTVDAAVASVLTRFGATNGSMSGTLCAWSCMATYQAIALALQLLAGKYEAACVQETQIVGALPTRVYPSLLFDAVSRVVVPLWSQPELVQGVQPFTVKALAALALMCTSAMSPSEGTSLSMSAGFMRAIPLFLDAPMPVVRLAGIVVADRVVGLSQQGAAKDAELIDFGLDDIIRDAKTTDQPATRASAEFIEEMRGFLRPVVEQWDDVGDSIADEPVEHASTLAEAVGQLGYNDDIVLAPRQSTLTGDPGMQSAFVQPRTPVFLRDCIAYLRDRDPNSDCIRIGLFALGSCIDRAPVKAVEELWKQAANKALFTYNRGPDSLDAEWDAHRQRALVALAVKLPWVVGPFLADRSSDRNLTLSDHELVLSAISTACLQLSGMDSDVESKPSIVDVTPRIRENAGAVGVGTVVRRSRRLDVVAREHAKQQETGEPLQMRKEYAGLVGPAFFSPLVSQFGRSDMTSASDMRRDASYLARYIDTLGVILYSAPSATHQLSMNRELWDLVRLVRRLPLRVSESPPVLNALLFGIDIVLSPDRALSTPTLAREFRMDVADTVQWIARIMDRGLLNDVSMAHASRIVERLRDIQEDVGRRVASSDFHQYTSII